MAALKASAVRFGTRITADVAANALTYIGVLLALVVVYVFFAMGTFGEVVDDPRYRPLFIVGTVFFFLGLAQVLRRGTGIPATATAIEIIGVIFVPIMTAALIRDGCTPAHAFWCLPDFNGPRNPTEPGVWRWLVYGGVGLFSAAIYYLFAKRRRLYAYMVVPVTWIAAGALGLYVEDGLGILLGDDPASVGTFVHDGISAWQFVAVLGSIALTIPLARRFRTSPIGRVVAVPSVRAGVVLAPFVVAVGFLVAYFDDALEGARPGLDDMAGPSISLFLSAAVVFATSSRAGFAFEALAARTRKQGAALFQAAAYFSVGAAWVSSAGYDLAPGWIGLGLVAYAFVVAVAGRITERSGGSVMWIARLSGTIGLSLTLTSPLPALIGWALPATVGLLAGRFASIDRVWSALVPVAGTPARRLRLWTPLFVALGAGAGRLAWPGGTAWVLAAAAAAFAAGRFARSHPDVAALSGFPAAAAGLSAVGIQSVLQARGGAMGGYEFGGLLLFLALVAAAVDVPWAVRLPATTGLLTAGSSVLLRASVVSTARDAAWADTGALAAFGLALVGGVLIGGAGRGTLLQGSLGHAFVLAALGRSLAFEQTALLGLGAVAVAYAAEAAAIETGRPGLFSRAAAGAGGAAETVRTVPTLVVAAVMIPIALLAGRHVPFIRNERPRFGPLLSALSWAYVTAAFVRRARTRRIVVPLALAVAASAIAVAIPSTTATLTTTWSAAAATAVLALALSRPYLTTVTWGLTVAATVATAVRLGLDRGDAHLVLHAVSLALLIGSALVNLRRGRPSGLASPWLRPPVAVAMLLIPASLAITISDSRYLAAVALSAAAAYAVLGWSTRTGGVSGPVAFMLAVAYARVVFTRGWAHPFDEPLIWMPLAALYVGATWPLPDRRSWRFLEDVSPGLFTAGLSLGGLALILSYEAAVTDAALAALAGVLLIAYLVRAHDAWLVAAVAALAGSGFIAGDHWTPLAAAVAALAAGVRSDHYADRPAGTALLWISAAWWAATFSLTAAWRDWNAAEVVRAAAFLGGGLLTAAAVLGTATHLPERARRWVLPMHVLGQLAAATIVVVAVSEFSTKDAYGVLAAVAAAEAVLMGTLGTMRRDLRLAAGGGALAAVAYGFSAAWWDWSTPQFLSITSAAGGTLLVLWIAGRLARVRPSRLSLWLPVAFAIAETAGASVVAVSWLDLDATAAAGVTAAVLGSQAVVAALMATALRSRALAATSVALTASVYGFTAGWAQWDVETFVGVTWPLGGTLITLTTYAYLRRAGGPRLRLWLAPTAAAGHLALLVAISVGISGLSARDASTIVAAAAAFESIVFGIVGSVERRVPAVAASVALAGTAYGFGVHAAGLTGVALVAWIGTAAAGAAVAATLVTRTRDTGSAARLWLGPTHGVAVVAAGATVITASSVLPAGAALWVAACVLFFMGTHLAVNAGYAPEAWSFRVVAALAYVASAGFALGGSVETGTAPGPVVFAVATAGLVSAVAWSAPGLGSWRLPDAVAAAGFEGVALVGSAAAFGIDGTVFASALLFAGAALGAHGLLERRLLAVEGGVVLWLVSAMIVIDEQLTLGLHGAVALISAALLVVLEIERRRRAAADLPALDALNRAEWILMIAPMALAAFSMPERLWYGLVLFAEGLAFTAWGAASRVLRRGLVGFGGVVLAVLLSAAIPIIEGARRGLTTNTWLVIAALAAVVFITIGSTIERRRVAIGRQLRRIGEIVEDWE